MNPKLSQPQMLCVSDDNIFLPVPIDYLLVDLEANKKLILSTLDLIQNSFTTNSCKDTNKIFNGLEAGHLLTRITGGKLLVFNASQSMMTTPKMKSNINLSRDEVIYSPTDERKLSNIGINLTNDNVSCDIFVASDSFIVLIFKLKL
jgi:hypothetical protein